MFKFILFVFTFLCTAGVSADTSLHSKGHKKFVSEQFSGSNVAFVSSNNMSNTSLAITGPNGFYVNEFASSGLPSIALMRDGELTDGLYMYEITTATGPMVFVKDTIDNGRGENNSHFAHRGVKQSGHFRVVDGQIKVFKQLKEPTAAKSY